MTLGQAVLQAPPGSGRPGGWDPSRDDHAAEPADRALRRRVATLVCAAVR
jgi:hypothetical protein